MQGLGDAIAKATNALGIEKCKGCEKRQAILNDIFPFKQKLTDEDITFLNNVFEWYKGLPIDIKRVPDLLRCEQIFLKVYNIKTGACKSCNATYQNNYMNKLKDLWQDLSEQKK